MKTYFSNPFRISSFALFLLMVFPFFANAITTESLEQSKKSDTECILNLYAPLTIDELASHSRKEIELKCNRKLTLMERLDLKIIKRSIKRNQLDKEALSICDEIDKRLKNSFGLAIVGLALFWSIGLIFTTISIVNSIIAKKKMDELPDCPEKEKNLKRNKRNLIISISTIILASVLSTFLISLGR